VVVIGCFVVTGKNIAYKAGKIRKVAEKRWLSFSILLLLTGKRRNGQIRGPFGIFLILSNAGRTEVFHLK
jgi:hypothetical protein